MVDAVEYSKSSLYETLKMLLVLFLCRRIDPFHQMLKSWDPMALQEVLSGSSLKENASPIRLGLRSQRFRSLEDCCNVAATSWATSVFMTHGVSLDLCDAATRIAALM